GRAGDRVLAIDRAADSGQLAIDVNDLHGKIAQAALQIGQLVSSLLRRILDLLPNLRQSLRVQPVQPILGRSSLRLSINQTVDTVSEISLSILQASPSILQLLIDLADRDVPAARGPPEQVLPRRHMLDAMRTSVPTAGILTGATEEVNKTLPLRAPDDDALYHWSSWKRSEEHTSELQSRFDLVCRLLLEKKKKNNTKVT